MKKVFCRSLLLTLATFCGVLTGCKFNDVFYTVTFKQNNFTYVEKVRSGEDLTDIPAPVEKTGYTVTWDRTEFTNITENIVVKAVEVANSYKVTYNAPGFNIDRTSVNLTYDSVCSKLDMSLTKVDSKFIGWEYNGVTYTNKSIWNVASNVSVTPKWVNKDQYTVTFVDSDGSTIVKTVYKGEELTDIPTPKEQVGYSSIVWDKTDFTNINENIEVNVLKTAKTYTVNFDPNGGTIETTSTTVTFGESYTFEKPIHKELRFVSWNYNGTAIDLIGTWNLDIDNGLFNLVAVWGESDWTEIL